MLATLARRARAALPNARRAFNRSAPAAAKADGADEGVASAFPSTLPMADPLVARVVAWHNAHPLAWKIDARHVVSIGHVWLPFEVPEKPPAKPGSRQGWKAAFSDNFIAPLRPRQVARWALKHGWQPFGEQAGANAVAQTGTPAVARAVRSVGPDARRGDRALETVWLATAAIELGATRRRVLLGHAADPQLAPVLGPRVWRRRRVAGVLATSSAVAGAALAVVAMQLAALFKLAPPGLADVAPTVMAERAAVVAVAASASASVPVSTAIQSPAASAPALSGPASVVAPAASAAITASTASTPSAATATAAASAAAAAAASAAPAAPAAPAALPEPPRVALAPPEPRPAEPGPAPSREKPQLVTPLDDTAKAAARDALAAARAARDEERRARGLPPLPTPAQAAASAAAAAKLAAAASAPPLIAQASQAAQTWALTSRVLRTRAESERLLLALRAAGAATKPAAQSQQRVFEVLSVGADWRAVGYPFASRAEAERARALLAQRGINVEVAAF